MYPEPVDIHGRAILDRIERDRPATPEGGVEQDEHRFVAAVHLRCRRHDLGRSAGRFAEFEPKWGKPYPGDVRRDRIEALRLIKIVRDTAVKPTPQP